MDKIPERRKKNNVLGKVDIKPSSFRQSHEVKVKDICIWKKKGICSNTFFFSFLLFSSYIWGAVCFVILRMVIKERSVFIAVKAIGHVSENHINRRDNV